MDLTRVPLERYATPAGAVIEMRNELETETRGHHGGRRAKIAKGRLINLIFNAVDLKCTSGGARNAVRKAHCERSARPAQTSSLVWWK